MTVVAVTIAAVCLALVFTGTTVAVFGLLVLFLMGCAKR